MKSILVAFTAFCISTPLLAQQSLPGSANLSFESVANETAVGWTLRDGSYFSRGKSSVQSVDSIHGSNAILLSASDSASKPAFSDPYFSQCVPIKGTDGTTVVVSAAMKFRKDADRSQNTFAHIWLRQAPNTEISRSEYIERDTFGWQRVSLTHTIDSGVNEICSGGELYGSYAQAWFDNFEISLN